MRWLPYLLLIAVTVLLQATLVGLVTIRTDTLGPVGPDLAALVVVFMALHLRSGTDAALTGWAAGTLLDLTTAGGLTGGTVIGPMGVGYVLGAVVVFRGREVLFQERAAPQIILAFLFTVVAHGVWALGQTRFGTVGDALGPWWLQSLAVALYTALLMPVAHWLLRRPRRWFIVTPTGRAGRGRV